MDFSNTLQIILNESPNRWQPLDAALEIMRKLESAKQLVRDIEHQLMSLKNRMNADLALSIKRSMPALSVGLDKNGYCKVGYKSKSLLFYPDVENGVWSVSSSDDRFKNKFNRSNTKKLVISTNINNLIEAITNYFTGHYKSLGEDIKGTGLIIVEGKLGTLKELVEWRDKECIRPLKSRLNRSCLTTN